MSWPRRHRTEAAILSGIVTDYEVWTYLHSTMSLRDIEDLPPCWGIDLTCELGAVAWRSPSHRLGGV